MKHTLGLNKNIETKKILVGIANFIQRNSEARYLSKGTQILTTEQEIRRTKKASVLLPLLQGIKDVKDVLREAKGGGVKSTELSINEFIVELANEKITEPIIYRPRDGEVIDADSILQRVQGSYRITGQTGKDIAFYKNILAQAVPGIDVAVGGSAGNKLKAEVVESLLETADNQNDTREKIVDNALKFVNQIRKVRNRIKRHKDRFLQAKIPNRDICIIVDADGEMALQNDARYNLRTDLAVSDSGKLAEDGTLNGSPVLVSKHLPDKIDFIVMVFGAATSLFAIREVLNLDKIPGVQAYASSMEFDEGTGV
jgi:hypothetical protein